MFNKQAGVFYRGIKPRGKAKWPNRPDKMRLTSLMNGLKNILQKAVRTKVQIVKGRYEHTRKTSYALSVFFI